MRAPLPLLALPLATCSGGGLDIAPGPDAEHFAVLDLDGLCNALSDGACLPWLLILDGVEPGRHVVLVATGTGLAPYMSMLRGDIEPITIGDRTNVQDGTVVHVDEGWATIVGADVTIGHRCVIHGCTIGDGALVGMGAVVLSGARVGEQALVAAGAVVREGFEVPPRTLCAGVPAKVIRELDDATLGGSCTRARRAGRDRGRFPISRRSTRSSSARA